MSASLLPPIDRSTARLEATETVFDNRLPDPAELVRFGGQVGIEYAMISAANLGAARGMGYDICREVPVVTVVGPSGECSVLTMARGKPIEAQSPTNGVRRWEVDKSILHITGLPEHEEIAAEVVEGLAIAPCGDPTKETGLGAHIYHCRKPECVAEQATRAETKAAKALAKVPTTE